MGKKKSPHDARVVGWTTIDLKDGAGPIKVRATFHGERQEIMHFDHKGLRYWASVLWPDSRWDRHPNWRLSGAPEPSRRAVAASNRRTVSAEEKQLVEEAVLRALYDYRSGASVAVLVCDVFENRGDLEDIYIPLRSRAGAVSAALRRLKKRGLVEQFWGPGERKEEVEYWGVPS